MTLNLFGDDTLPLAPKPAPAKAKAKQDLSKDFWNPAPVGGLARLLELRAQVLEHTTARMPKWKMRVAADFVVELQPKASGWLFEGVAVERPGAGLEDLSATPEGEGWRRLRFEIGDGTLAVSSCRMASAEDGIDWAEPMRQRLIDTFSGGAFAEITPSQMLACSCLICGKALTDPISKARLIGPECASETLRKRPYAPRKARASRSERNIAPVRNRPLTDEQKAAVIRAVGTVQRGEWPEESETRGPKFECSDGTGGFAFQHPVSGQVVWEVHEINGKPIAGGNVGMSEALSF